MQWLQKHHHPPSTDSCGVKPIRKWMELEKRARTIRGIDACVYWIVGGRIIIILPIEMIDAVRYDPI